MPVEPRLAAAQAHTQRGALAGVGIGLVQQHRTVARLEARHRDEQARLGAQLDAVNRSLAAMQSDLGDARNHTAREDHRLGVLVHDLDRRLEQLRQLTEPMVAEVDPEAPAVAQ